MGKLDAQAQFLPRTITLGLAPLDRKARPSNVRSSS